MLRNPRVIKDAYECGKLMADWLVFKKQLPLLGIDKNVYFFTNDGKLLEAL